MYIYIYWGNQKNGLILTHIGVSAVQKGLQGMGVRERSDGDTKWAAFRTDRSGSRAVLMFNDAWTIVVVVYYIGATLAQMLQGLEKQMCIAHGRSSAGVSVCGRLRINIKDPHTICTLLCAVVVFIGGV